MKGKRHRVPFCSCEDLRELARTSASAIAIIDLHKRWPPFPIAGTGARALLRALASVARMRACPLQLNERSRKRHPELGANPLHIAEPVIAARAQLRSSRARDPLAHAATCCFIVADAVWISEGRFQ